MDVDAAKRLFFDRAAVIDAVDAGTRKLLSKFGAFVRTRARTSIRKRKKPAPPGSPPSSHVGTLKRRILFGYDPVEKSVVIGPTLDGSRSGAPERLEEGGPGTVVDGLKRRTVQYRPRPYMRPAFETEREKVGNDLRNLIK